MPHRRRSLISLVAVVGLLAAAGSALAAPPDTPGDKEGDTVFNYGYDSVNHVLMANSSSSDFTYDCGLGEQGLLTAGYLEADPETGLVPVETLDYFADGPVMFTNRPLEEVGPDYDPADVPALYAGSEEPCGIYGISVAGPNGQINHGQFMKAFHALVDKRGMGCLNRLIAQSDLGKGPQQIRTSDVDPEFVAAAMGDVEFSTALADCKRGKKDKGDDHPGNGGGLDKAWKTGDGNSPGKSGEAKGRNK